MPTIFKVIITIMKTIHLITNKSLIERHGQQCACFGGKITSQEYPRNVYGWR